MSTGSESKPQFQSEVVQSDFEEFDAAPRQPVKSPLVKVTDSVRLGLTALALLSAVVILGTSAETLATFNNTHQGDNYLLPLWPTDFDLRPTTALVACSVVIIVSSAISLALNFLPTISALLLTLLSLFTPIVSLIAGLVGTSFFYGVNTSTTTSSLQSWSCQWSAIDMGMKPHWGSLCKESKTGLYLMVMMIPLEVIVLSTVVVGMFAQKKEVVRRDEENRERKGSPAMS